MSFFSLTASSVGDFTISFKGGLRILKLQASFSFSKKTYTHLLFIQLHHSFKIYFSKKYYSVFPPTKHHLNMSHFTSTGKHSFVPYAHFASLVHYCPFLPSSSISIMQLPALVQAFKVIKV